MEEEVSESTSTIGEDWEKDGDCSIDSSFVISDSKEASLSDSGTPPHKDNLALRWARLLGVRNKTDPHLFDWDQLYNLRSQNILRNDCRQLAKRINNSMSVPELETFFTLYCKKRQMDYIRGAGWMEIFEKIVPYELTQETLFNVFFAVTTKFIPRDTRKNSQIYDLFRLILQYHDPTVCTKLETLKCSPYLYTRDWFCTLLASKTDDKPCNALWTFYFERGDPFLIFYMILVLIVNARDEILEFTLENREKALTFLENLPKNITEEDVLDFVELAAYYSQHTPQCVKEDFHCMIFGANLVDEFNEISLSRLICFPISIQELIRKERTTRTDAGSPEGTPADDISYFVVDCRTTELFNKGSIAGSFNLDCQLIVDEPEKFAIAVKSLQKYKKDQRKDDQYCFIGYGDENLDQHMIMVISKFLADGIQYICVLDGGFKALHTYHMQAGQLKKLKGHDEYACDLCQKKDTNTSGVLSLVSRLSKAVVNKGSIVKGKVNEMVTSKSMPEAIGHVSTKDRHGKKYRKQPAVFSIDGSSSEDDTNAMSVYSHTKDTKEKLELASFLSGDEIISSFVCQEMVGEKSIPSYIALSRTHMHILHESEHQPGYATTSARLLLTSVFNVTCRKKIPEVLTFKFGYETAPGEVKISAIHRFYVPKAGECASAVKRAIFAITPPHLTENQ